MTLQIVYIWICLRKIGAKGFMCAALAPVYARRSGSEDERMDIWAQAQLLGPKEMRFSFVAFFISTS
jgi:hypothetical protein